MAFEDNFLMDSQNSSDVCGKRLVTSSTGVFDHGFQPNCHWNKKKSFQEREALPLTISVAVHFYSGVAEGTASLSTTQQQVDNAI